MALFYPINPGHEVESWKRLHDEAFDKFISVQYAGDYEEGLITEFDSYLPERPPWEKRRGASRTAQRMKSRNRG